MTSQPFTDQVLVLLTNAGTPMTIQELALYLNLTTAQVTNAMKKLVEQSKVENIAKSGAGEYRIPLKQQEATVRMREFRPLQPMRAPIRRPTIDAPGCVVREGLTGRVLA